MIYKNRRITNSFIFLALMFIYSIILQYNMVENPSNVISEYLCVFTNYLYELCQHHPILQIMSEVGDKRQPWFPLKLRVHPGNVCCQLLLELGNHTYMYHKTQTETHKTA